jgi:hypothetical protein
LQQIKSPAEWPGFLFARGSFAFSQLTATADNCAVTTARPIRTRASLLANRSGRCCMLRRDQFVESDSRRELDRLEIPSLRHGERTAFVAGLGKSDHAIPLR